MKALAALLMLALPASAIDLDALKAKPDELRNIKTVTMADVEKNLQAFRGKVVRVKFTCRDKQIDELPDGGFMGAVWYFDAKCESGSMLVLFPKEALAWFTRISPDSMARRAVFAYMRIEDKEDSSKIAAVVLGREIKLGTKGPELIW